MPRSSNNSLPSSSLVLAMTNLLQNSEEHFGNLGFKCVKTEEGVNETILCHRAIILSRTTPEFRSSYFPGLEELAIPSNTNQTIQLSIPFQECESIIHHIYTNFSTIPDVTQQLSDNPSPSIIGFDLVDFTDSKHMMRLKLDLLKMWRDNIYTDITLALGTSLRFPVHRCILSVQSPYFQAMLVSPFRESHLEILELNDEVVTPNALTLVLGFMYTGDLLFSLLPTKPATTPSTPSTSLSSAATPTYTKSSSSLKASPSSKPLLTSSKNSSSSKVTTSLSKLSPAKTSSSPSKPRVLGRSSASPAKHSLTHLKSNLTLPMKRQRLQILQNLYRSADYFSMETLITLTYNHIGALVHHFSDLCVDCCVLIPLVLSFSSEKGLDTIKEKALGVLSNPLKISSWSHRAFADLSANLHEEILSLTLARITAPVTIQILTQLHTLQNSPSITSITKPLLIHTSHRLAAHIETQTRPASDIDGHELSTPLLDLLVGVGFATDSLEFILNSLVDNLTDSTAVSVYQALIMDLLPKKVVKDNTQIKEVIEQAKAGVVAYLRRRWVGVKAVGLFEDLKEGIVEKIAKDIGVDVDELKRSVAGTAELGGFSLGDTEFARWSLHSSPLNKIATSKARPTTTTSSPSPSRKFHPATTSSSPTVTRGRIGTSAAASRRGTASATSAVVSPASTRGSRATTTARGSTLNQTSSRGNAPATPTRARGITPRSIPGRANTASRPTSSTSPTTPRTQPRSTTTTNILPRDTDTNNASP